MSDIDFVPPTTLYDPRIGAVLQDRYRIVKKLSEGGMGVVYEGEHIMIRRRVAIKFLHSQFASNPEVVARFHREALATTAIGNEHIVEVTDMGHFDDGSLFMVLEFLDGRNLANVIEQEGPQSLGRVTRIVCQICDALNDVHARGIVHRDLKPENIFLISRSSTPDYVKILDFGISKFKTSLDGKDARMTNTGATLGTPHFMSPEQAEGVSDIDHRTDIYALGCIMYYALTGKLPFDAPSFALLIVRICSQNPPPIIELRPDLPQPVVNTINKMMAKERDARFARCADIKPLLVPYLDVNHPPDRVDKSDAPNAVASDGKVYRDISFGETRIDSNGEVEDERSDRPDRDEASSGEINASRLPASYADRLGETDLRRRIPKTSLRALWVGGFIALAIGLVGLSIGIRSGGDRETATPPQTGKPSERATNPVTAANRQSATQMNATAEAPPLVEKIRVKISTVPSTAELYLDGVRVANPFDAELPKSVSAHALRARHEGYKEIAQQLVLRVSQTIQLELQPKTRNRVRRVAAKKNPKKKSTPTTNSSETTRHAPMGEVPTDDHHTVQPTTPELKPSSRVSQPKRTISTAPQNDSELKKLF